MAEEARVENIGRDFKRFLDAIQGEPARLNSVVASEDFFDNRSGARFESLAQLGFGKDLPAFFLGVTLGRGGRSQADYEHAENYPETLDRASARKEGRSKKGGISEKEQILVDWEARSLNNTESRFV